MTLSTATVETIDLAGFSQWVIIADAANIRFSNSTDVNDANYFDLPDGSTISSDDHPEPEDGRMFVRAVSGTPRIHIAGIRRTI
jgi:hypothetical protein